jgi:hypothetical protein
LYSQAYPFLLPAWVFLGWQHLMPKIEPKK